MPEIIAMILAMLLIFPLCYMGGNYINKTTKILVAENKAHMFLNCFALILLVIAIVSTIEQASTATDIAAKFNIACDTLNTLVIIYTVTGRFSTLKSDKNGSMSA